MTETTQYTIEPSRSLLAHSVKIDGRIVAYINWHGGLNDATRERILSMFSVAPELLAACEALVRECNMYLGGQDRNPDGTYEQPGDESMASQVMIAQAALAKARP